MFNIELLNPQQRSAVESIAGPLLILAGAGTGKTRVMTCRMAHMIERGIDPESIVGVTFTNKSAKEMRERLGAMIAPAASKKVFIGTFHSFCIQIIKKYAKECGLRPRVSLTDMSDQVDIMRRVLEEKGLEGFFKPFDVLQLVSKLKNQLLSPEQTSACQAAIAGDKRYDDLPICEIYHAYEKYLQFNNAIDFDDCIFKCAKLLLENESVRKELQEKYRYLLVDEFQDTNYSQLRLVQLLCETHRNLCVVGDDDQSIYSWRGAEYRIFKMFEEYFPETKYIKLEENYRCPQPILDIANAVIKNNQSRKDKTLWSSIGDAKPIELTSHLSDATELEYICNKIIVLQERAIPLDQIAILCRSGNQMRSMETTLRERSIPYLVSGGQSFFDKKEVKDFLAYVKLILNPKDVMSFFRVVNTPPRGIGMKTLEKLHQAMDRFSKPPIQTAKILESDDAIQVSQALHSFCGQIQEASAEFASHQNFQSLGDTILKTFRPTLAIEKSIKDPQKRAERIDLCRSLPEWLARSWEQYATDPGIKHSGSKGGKPNVLEFVNHMILDNNPEALKVSDRKDKHLNKVCLSTVHAAKGLEYQAVFIPGLEDDVMPHKNSHLTQQGIQEERRLFYVAMTRSKQYLFLSYKHYKKFRGKTIGLTRSRFLDEIPRALLQQSQVAEAPTEERASNLVSRLKSFRQSLGESLKESP